MLLLFPPGRQCCTGTTSPVTSGCTSTQTVWDIWFYSLWKQPLLNTTFLTSHTGEPVFAHLNPPPPPTPPVATLMVPSPAKTWPSRARRGHLAADTTLLCSQLHTGLPHNELCLKWPSAVHADLWKAYMKTIKAAYLLTCIFTLLKENTPHRVDLE